MTKLKVEIRRNEGFCYLDFGIHLTLGFNDYIGMTEASKVAGMLSGWKLR